MKREVTVTSDMMTLNVTATSGKDGNTPVSGPRMILIQIPGMRCHREVY